MAAKPLLTPEEALQKRTQLCEDGYCIIPGVMGPELLEEMRAWTTSVFEKYEVQPELRYQGSDFHVMPTRAWKSSVHAPKDGSDTLPFGQTILTHHDLIGKLNDLPAQKEAARLLQLENLRPGNGNSKWGEAVVQLLSKPPYGPPLYWHQDWMGWNNPLSTLPWPQVIFFSYYLSDTTPENGCLRVIPGSHLKPHPLHEILPNAHEPEVQSLENLDSPVFQNAEGAIDVCMKAGDLIIGDARLLHSAWPNKTNQRRTLSLAWYNVFDAKSPPSWWGERPIPDLIKEVWASTEKPRYKPTRCANVPWRPRGEDYQSPWAEQYPAIMDEARKGAKKPKRPEDVSQHAYYRPAEAPPAKL